MKGKENEMSKLKEVFEYAFRKAGYPDDIAEELAEIAAEGRQGMAESTASSKDRLIAAFKADFAQRYSEEEAERLAEIAAEGR